jgi:hypothetical protein
MLFVRPRDGLERLESWALEIACLAVVAVGLVCYVWLARRPREPFPATVVLTATGR